MGHDERKDRDKLLYSSKFKRGNDFTDQLSIDFVTTRTTPRTI